MEIFQRNEKIKFYRGIFGYVFDERPGGAASNPALWILAKRGFDPVLGWTSRDSRP